MNRRKLGSSRKSKGRQHVKEPETEQELEPRKDVQEETWGIATLQTQVTATTQLEIQEESGQESEYTSAKCVTSLVSAPTHTSKNESTAMLSSEGEVEIVVSKDSDVQDCKVETKLEVNDKSVAQKEETKDCLFEITNKPACLSVDQQTINIEKRSNMYFVSESDLKKKADTDLFSQDESFQGKFSVSESHIKKVSESTTPEKTVDNSTNKVNTEIKNVEQEIIVFPKEELATNEGKGNVFNQINVRDVQCPEKAVTKVDKAKEVYSMDQTDYYPGSLKLQLQQDSDLCFENTTQSDLNAPSDLQLQDKSSSTDGQTDANFSFSVGRRKLGSSRRNKDRQHVKESEEKVEENAKVDETLKTQNISLQIQTRRQKKLTQDTEQDNFLSISHDGSMSSMYLLDDDSLVQGSMSTKYAETYPQRFISTYETLNETELDVKQEMVKNSEDITQEKVNESDTLHSEDTKGVISEGTLREMQEEDFHLVQMQENLQTDHSMGTGDGVKPCEMVCETLPGYAKISELTVKSMEQSTIKHVCPTKEDLSDDADIENESHLNAMSQPTEKNMSDSATKQEKNLTTDDQTFYQETAGEGDELNLSTLQSETVFVDTNDNDPKTVDEQINTGFDKKGKRKRLGSKQRKRLRSLNESKQDLFVNIKPNVSPEATPISLETTVVTQKLLKQDTDCDISHAMSHDSSMNLMPSPEHSAKIHISGAKEYSDLDVEIFNSKRKNASENLNGIDTYNNSESVKLRDTAPVDESDSFLNKKVITPHDSVNAVGLKVLADLKTQVQESLQIDNIYDTVTNDASENLKVVTGKDKGAISEAERNDICVQSPLSDLNYPSNPQHQDKSLSMDEKTGANFSLSGNTRKLGSRRGRKGRQRVQDSEIEQDQEPRKEIQEESSCIKNLQAQASEATQLETQEEDESQYSTSAGCDVSLVLDYTRDFSEFRKSSAVSFPEDEVSKDETNLEEIDKSDITQTVETKQSTHECLSELLNFSACLSSDQQTINKHKEFLNVYISDELETNKNADTDLFRQDESFKGNYSGSESHVKTDSELTTPEITANNSTNITNRKTKDSIAQAVNVLPNEELALNEEKNRLFKLSKVRDGQYTQDVVDKIDIEGTKLNLWSAGEEKLVEEDAEHFIEQLSNQEEICPETENNNISVQSSLTDLKTPSEPQLQEKSLSIDKQTSVNVSFRGSTSKLGSSHKNKEKQLGNEFKVVGIKNTKDNRTLEGPKTHPKPDTQSLILQSKNLQKDQDEEKDLDVDIVEKSLDDTKEDEDKSDMSYSEDIRNVLTDGAQLVGDEVKVHLTQIPENLQIDFSSQAVTSDGTEICEGVSESLSDLSEISELKMKTIKDDNEENLTEVNISKALELKHDSSDSWDMNTQVEKGESTVSQVYEFKDTVEDETEPKPENIFQEEKSDIDQKEGTHFESTTFMYETVLFDSTLHKDSETVDEQTNRGTNNSSNSKKHRSRNKGRQLVKEKKEDIVWINQADEAPKTIQSTLKTKASQEIFKQDIKCDITLPVSHDISVFSEHAPAHSSEIQITVSTKHSEPGHESFVPKSKSPPEKTDEKDTDSNAEISNKSGETTPVIATRQEQIIVNQTTQILENLQIDYSSDTMADEAPFNPEVLIGRLNEQIENYNKNFKEKSTPDSANIQEQIIIPTVEESLETVLYKNEDDCVHQPKQTWINNTERKVIALSQTGEAGAPLQEYIKHNSEENVHLEGVSYEAERNNIFVQIPLTDFLISSDPQLQDKSQSTEEQTDANLSFSGSRKKLGSSRRNKGRHHDKKSKEEEIEITKDEEVLETLKVSEIKPTTMKEITQDLKHDSNLPVAHDSSMSPMPLPGHFSDVQSSDPTTHPETNPQNVTLQKDQQTIQTEINMRIREASVDDTKEGLDQSETCHSLNIENVLSADVQLERQEDEVHPTQIQESLQMKLSSETATFVDYESCAVVSGPLNHQEKISELTMNTTVDVETTQDCQDATILTREELKQVTENDIDLLVSHDSSMFAANTPGHSSEVPSTVPQSHPEPDLESLVPKSESLPEQSMLFTVEESLETVMHNNEDDCVYQLEQTLINNTEREVIVLSQTGEGEASLQEDIKHSSEENVIDGVCFEAERTNVFVQSPLTDVKFLSDPQLQDKSQSTEEQTDANLSFSGSRRKLGSSHRNKGRHYGKESKEEEIEITKDEEVLETLKVSEIKPTTMKEITQDLKHDSNLPVAHDSSMSPMPLPGHFSDVQSSDPTTHPETNPQNVTLQKDQQTIQTEINMRIREASVDDTKEGLDQSETCHSLNIENVLSADVQLERQEDEVHPTQIQESLQMKLSSETATFVDYESCAVVSGPLNHQEKISELTMNTTVDVETTQDCQDATILTREELKQVTENDIDLLVSHDSSMFAANTPGHSSEVPSTVPQSHPEPDLESLVPKSESLPEQSMLFTVEESLETVMHNNEDDCVYQLEQTLINNTEREVTVLSQTGEGEASLQEDIKHSSEENVIDGVCFEAERTNVFVQSPLTDVKFPPDPQLQDKSQSTEEQTDANLSFSGSRRKLGSSRRNKGRHRGKESKDHVSENTLGDEVLETLKVSLEINPTTMKKNSEGFKQDVLSVSHDSSMSPMPLPGHFSDVQSSDPTTHPETSPQNLTVKSDNLQKDQQTIQTEFTMRKREASVDDTKEGLGQPETCHSLNIENVLSADVQLERQEDEVHPTQMPKNLQIDFSLQTVVGDGTVSCEVVSEPLTDLIEISELTVKATDDSAINQQEYLTGENISEASDLKHDNSKFSTIKQQCSDLKEVESSVSLVKESNDRAEDNIKLKTQHVFYQKKEGLFLDKTEEKSAALSSETVSSDSRHESITVGDQTNSDFSKNGNKRKMGLSRRNKGRQQIKEFNKEVLENTNDDTALETTVLIDIKTTEQKELTEDKNHDNLLSVSPDSSMSLMPSPDHSSEVQSSKATKYPETETQILIIGSQNLEDAKTEREPDINVKMVEESVGPMQQEIDTFGAFYSDDLLDNVQREVQKVEKHPTQMQRSLQIESSSEGFKGDTTEMFDIISESFTKEDEISDLNNANKPQISDLEEVDPALRQAHEFKDRVEVDINPKSEQTFHQEQAKHVLSTLQSENVSFDSQPQNDSLSVHEQTNMEFHNSGSRRKLGSSRRTKGRQAVKDSVTETYKKPIEEDEEKVGGNKLSETTLMLESTGQKEDNLHPGAFDWTSELVSVGVHSTSKADEKVIDKPMIPDGDFSSKSTEPSIKDRCSEENLFVPEPEVCPVMSEINTDKSFSREEINHEDQIKKTLPKVNTSKSPQHTEDGVEKAHEQEVDQEQTEDVVCDTAEKETDDLVKKTEIESRNIFYSTKSKEKEEDTEMFRCLRDSDVSAMPETTTEKSSYKEHTEVKYSVEQEAVSSHDNLPTNKEQDESNKIYETTETLRLENIGIKDHEEIEPGQMQDMHHVDLISLPQNMFSVQTLQPHSNVALDSDSQDNYQSNKDETHSGLRAAGSRRKMGSSRKIKGRQNAKFTEANQEHKEEDVETSENDAATQMFATKTVTPREFKDLTSVENFETITSNEDKKAEKEPEGKSLFSREDLNNKTVTTSDIITSSDKEDTNNKPSEDTKEKHVKLAHDLDDFSQLTGRDTDKNSLLMQSPEASVSKGTLDMESILHHDDIISSEPGNVSVPEQDKAIQHQSRGAGTLEEDVELQQTKKVTETGVCVASESSSTNVQDPQLEVVGEKRVYADQEIESISASEEPPVDVSFKSEASTMDFGQRQQGKTSSDFSESFEAKSKQKKKKFGSSRRTPVIKQERETHNLDETKTDSKADDGMRSLEKIKVVEELPSTTGVESENVQLSYGDLVQQEADEAKTTDSDKHKHVQGTEEQKPGNMSEGIHSQTIEVKSESPDFSSTNRRRKMGSTRRNLGSGKQRENMDQEEEQEIETAGGDVTSEKVSEIIEEKLQVQAESKKSDSDQRKEKVFETAAISQIGEALLKPVAEEEPEESPVSPSQDDFESEPASGGRRKKFGSNRKSHLQQRNRDQNESEVGLIGAQKENDARGTAEEGPHETAEQQTVKSSGVEKITKVDKNDDKVSVNISIPETKVPLSEAPRKLYPDENLLGQEGEGQLSFGTNKSNSYNVVLVGESSVGKSSFMKRALSGKFALDIPASVGLDSCKWTVVIDGKPVLLQLWDTAGQERFHSITRHIFHKAQAFLLMYDITSSQSFSAVSYWANCIQESAAENVTVLLLGNKSDHAERQVKTEQGDILAKEYNFGFMECSASTGQNVIEALETVARMLNQRSDLREEATVLEQRSVPKSQSRCC